MKTIAALLPIMFLHSSVLAQAVPVEVKQAVTNAIVQSYSRFFVTETELIKCEEGNPPQEFIGKYNPKRVYVPLAATLLFARMSPAVGRRSGP